MLDIVQDTIVGSCATSYSFGATDVKGRYSLIKQRTMSDCTGVPKMGMNMYGSSNCEGKQDEMLATTQAYYQFSRTPSGALKPHIISSLGYQVLQWYPPAGTPMYNTANQTLILKSAGAISEPIAEAGLTKHYDSLRYKLARPIPSPDQVDLTREEDFFHPEEPMAQSMLQDKMHAQLLKVEQVAKSSPIDESTLTNDSVMGAIHMMGQLSLDSLRVVYDKCAAEGEDLRRIFVQVLGFCGSNPSAMMAKELVLGGKLTELQTRRLISFLPYNLRLPTEKLLTEFEVLLKESEHVKSRNVRSAMAMAFGHLVGVTCSNPMRPACHPDTLSKYSRVAVEAFKNAKTHVEQMVTLLALGNTRLQGAVEKLVPMARPGQVSRLIRPHVINNLAPLAKYNRNKFLAAIMPILLNQTEETEVRIAAVATLFQVKPTFLELQQITAGLLWERNAEFSNFVLTTFRNYVDSKSPCLRELTGQLQMLLRRVAHMKTSPFRSSNRVFDYHDAKYGFGGALQLATVYGDESRAPLVIAATAQYRISTWTYVPIQVIIRLEGVEDAFVKMFRGLDAKDFKMDALKDLLQKALKVAPRQQNAMKAEVVVRSQNFNILYRHLSMQEIGAMLAGQTITQAVAKGLSQAVNMVMLGGTHMSWRANDIGVPVGVGVASPGLSRMDVSYGAINEPGKIARSVSADLDVTHQVVNYLVAYNPLGASQGIVKMRGSRLHLPINFQIAHSPPSHAVELKMATPTAERPMGIFFTSKTLAFMWGKDTKRAVAYLKDSCAECSPAALVSEGADKRTGSVVRDKLNERLGLESHVEVYDCESYTGKATAARLLFNSFKPSEINSHGSVPGFMLMGLMQLRNYFYFYPPTAACSMKALVHQARENPATAIEIQLKRDQNPPAGKSASKTKRFDNLRGTVTFDGAIQRQWKVDIGLEAEPFNVKSVVSVKIARQPVAELSLPARALCVQVKTAWSQLPLDVFETPSAVEPSVQRDVTFVWGEAPTDECPKASAKGVSTITAKVQGNITDFQRRSAAERTTYPYDRCDKDRTDQGRSGVVLPMTRACYDAVVAYATPKAYVYNVHYENLSDRGMMALHRIRTAVTASLLPYWEIHTPVGMQRKTTPNSGHMEVKITFNPRDTDLHVNTDVLHSRFENVEYMDNVAELILRNARLPVYQSTMIKTGLVGVCTVAPKGAVTLDNATLSYNLPGCWTLASADCSPEPRYAAFVKRTADKSLPIAAKIYIGGHSLELSPSDAGIDITANNKKINVEMGKPYKMATADGLIEFMTITKLGQRYFIQAPAIKLTFRYTGDDLTAMVPATHRSSHCGICGDYNGQTSREFVGASGCTHKDAQDMIKSYVWKKDCSETVGTPSCAADSSPIDGKARGGIVDFLDQVSN